RPATGGADDQGFLDGNGAVSSGAATARWPSDGCLLRGIVRVWSVARSPADILPAGGRCASRKVAADQSVQAEERSGRRSEAGQAVVSGRGSAGACSIG